MKDLDLMFEEDRVAYENIIKAINSDNPQAAIKDLDMLVDRLLQFEDALVNQHEEFETETHIATREAFWSYEGEIRYGYCLYEWTGGYDEVPENIKKLIPDFKKKAYREIFHCTNTERQKLNKEWIDDTLKLLDLLQKGKKNGNK